MQMEYSINLSFFKACISKIFNKVCQKSLISRIPSFRFYLFFCDYLSCFLSGRSRAEVGGHRLSFKTIKSCVTKGSVIFSNFFPYFSLMTSSLLFHHLFSSISISPSFIIPFILKNPYPKPQKWTYAKRVALGQLTENNSRISILGREITVVFTPEKFRLSFLLDVIFHTSIITSTKTCN